MTKVVNKLQMKRAEDMSISFRARASEESPQISPLEEEVLTVINAYVKTYGFQIIHTFEKASRGQRKLSIGTLYPLLNRLYKKGMVESHMADKSDPTGGARRKYFSITDKGKLALSEAQEFRRRLHEFALARV